MESICISLPAELHAQLKRESEASRTPMTVLARRALSDWLNRQERKRLGVDLHAFAVEHAGSELDLDEVFERAAQGSFHTDDL